MFLPKIRGRRCESFYRQRSKKSFCILDFQHWPGQMCGEKTGMWRGSNRSLSGDFAFGQLLDNLCKFWAQIAAVRKLDGANTGRSAFDKGTESKRVVR